MAYADAISSRPRFGIPIVSIKFKIEVEDGKRGGGGGPDDDRPGLFRRLLDGIRNLIKGPVR